MYLDSAITSTTGLYHALLCVFTLCQALGKSFSAAFDSTQRQSSMRKGFYYLYFACQETEAWKGCYLCKVKQLVSRTLRNRIQAWPKGCAFNHYILLFKFS